MQLRALSIALLVAASFTLPTADVASAARPELDAVGLAAPGAAATARLARIAADPALRGVGRAADLDRRFGVPTFVWAIRPARAEASAASRVPRPTPEGAARAQLARFAPFYGLDPADVAGATLTDVHDTGRGGIVVSFHQSVNGVEVFRDAIHVLLDRNLAPVAVTGYIPSRGLAGRGGTAAFRRTPAEAIAAALRDFTGKPVVAASVRRTGDAPGGYGRYELTGGGPAGVHTPIRSKRVYFHLPGRLEPGDYVELMSEDDAASYVVSAVDGRLLFRHSQIASDAFGYRVWADAGAPDVPMDGPQGDDPTPHPTATPDFYRPPFVAPGLVTLQNGPISTNDPWLAPGATETSGNNVDAYADLVAPDGFSAGDLRATTTSANTFDRVYDTSQPPDYSNDQQMAAITQLFYDCNFLHDWYYDAGFDEASGNAQVSNYGRGGVEGDPLHAEAQDYGGINNANMTTPADGASPRMQMYVWNLGPYGTLNVNSPGSIAGTYDVGTASFGPQAFSATGDVVLVDDGTGTTSDGCEAITNDVSGKIALIDRGTCTFTQKVLNAQSAGAIGVIIVDNSGASTPPALGGTATGITIGTVSVTTAVGNSIKTALTGNTVNATISLQPQLTRDGTIDNQVVAHEWGHYISNRLIGNGNGLGTNQAGGLGEGWGDFSALIMTVRPGDDLVASNPDFGGVYALAAYASNPSLAPSNSYYFGLRRYPYSTDLSLDPLTFRHITTGEPLPSGPPVSLTYVSSDNAEVHNTGEVWAVMLWECYAALLRDSGRLTFDQARDHMRDDLVTAFKLTPVNPTFVEARDAVLAAALASDHSDYTEFWAAFAKRGIGIGAVAPDRYSSDNSGVVESFLVGGDLAFVSGDVNDTGVSCDDDGYLDENETGQVVVTLANTGSTNLASTSATVSSTNPAISFPAGNLITFPASSPFGTTTGSVAVHMSGAVGSQVVDIELQYNDPGLVVPGPRAASFGVVGNVDEVPSTTETVEAKTPTWTMTGDPLYSVNAPWTRTELDPTHHVFFAPDPGGLSDEYLESPPIQVAGAGSFSFQFTQVHSFEKDASNFYDGGVIEISTDGGTNWSDIGAFATPGYGGTIFVGAGNPLSGRQAYVGQNASYPSPDLVTVNLGTAYAGQTVRVRFRVGSDEAVSDFGWQVDDLAFSNITNQPFLALVADPDACNPVAVGDALPTALAFTLVGGNPVGRDATFRFALPHSGRVAIALFDLAGRRVASLADGDFAAGYHTARWREAGSAGGPGVYFARMIAGGRTLTRRVVVLY